MECHSSIGLKLRLDQTAPQKKKKDNTVFALTRVKGQLELSPLCRGIHLTSFKRSRFTGAIYPRSNGNKGIGFWKPTCEQYLWTSLHQETARLRTPGPYGETSHKPSFWISTYNALDLQSVRIQPFQVAWKEVPALNCSHAQFLLEIADELGHLNQH